MQQPEQDYVEVSIQILRFVDESQPGWVECKLIDAKDYQWLFTEKIPIVTDKDLWSDSSYPQQGAIRCKVISSSQDELGRKIIHIDTDEPWGVASIEGITQFEIFETQLCKLDH